MRGKLLLGGICYWYFTVLKVFINAYIKPDMACVERNILELLCETKGFFEVIQFI